MIRNRRSPQLGLLTRRVVAAAKADQVPLLSAGVAFYAMFSLFPAMVGAASLYGLLGDPTLIDHQVRSATGGLPYQVRDILAKQLAELATTQSRSGLGLGALLGVLAAFWSASTGTRHLIVALNAVMDRRESRGFVRLRVTAFVLTAGAVVFVTLAVGLLALLPTVLSHTEIAEGTQRLANLARVPLLAAGMVVGVTVLYRFGPDHGGTSWRWTSWGALTATILWTVGSALFAYYTATIENFNRFYGALGVVIVLLLWLLLSAAAVLVGAEVENELTKLASTDDTADDTTDAATSRSSADGPPG